MSYCRILRVVVTVVILLACSSFSYATSGSFITAEELDRVFAAIRQNDWGLVEKEVFPLTESSSYPQRYLIARLLYIYVHSLAVQTGSGKLKYVDLKEKLSKLENRLIIQPWHPINPNAGPCFNQICPDPDNPSVLGTSQSNRDGTLIYSFEWFDMGMPIRIDSFSGQNARLGGILKKIEINDSLPNAEQSGSSVTWILRLKVGDGFINYKR